MNNATYYARVSSSAQEEKGTIESQIEELKRQILGNKDILVDEYIDNGWSGARLDRPELDRLRADIKTDKFETVYFLNADRIARESAYQNIILSELIKAKKRVIINGKDLANDPDSKFLYTILGAVSELEKAKIIERTSRGRLYRARQGIIMSSAAPYGYNLILKTDGQPTKYVVNESESKIVQLIFDLYAHKGQSIKRISKYLFDNGFKSRRSNIFRSSTLKRILTNTAYIGTVYYNKYEGIETDTGKKYRANLKNSTRLKPKELWIPQAIPIIIDNNTFELAQSILVNNKHFKRGGSNFYLLSGLLKCACGGNICGDLSKGGRTYRCNNRHRRFPEPKNCFIKAISIDRLDSAVNQCLEERLFVPKILAKHISILQEKVAYKTKELDSDIQRITGQINSIIGKKEKVLDLYSEGLISKEGIANKIKELDSKKCELEESINENRNKKLLLDSKPQVKRSISEFCRLAVKRYSKLSDSSKKQFLSFILTQIIYDGKQLVIKGVVPISLGDSLDSGQSSQHAVFRKPGNRQDNSCTSHSDNNP